MAEQLNDGERTHQRELPWTTAEFSDNEIAVLNAAIDIIRRNPDFISDPVEKQVTAVIEVLSNKRISKKRIKTALEKFDAAYLEGFLEEI